MMRIFLGRWDFLRLTVLRRIHPRGSSGLGCDERRAGFRPFPALLSEVQKKGKETYMSLEHLKELIEDDARDGYIYDYSDVELTLALLQEKIASLTSGEKEKLRVIIEAELARDLKAMQCITTKIHDEINADLAWAWRTWEKEYIAAEEWKLERKGKEHEFQFENFFHCRSLISRTVKRLILPRLEANAGNQMPHQGSMGPLSGGLDQEMWTPESPDAGKPSNR
jgi:hypothetical protein